MAAAMGRVQLARAESMSRRRADIARRYSDGLDGLDDLVLPTVPEDRESAWHLYIVRLREPHGEPERDRLIDDLKAAGIGVSMHFIPLHLHSHYATVHGYTPEDLPVAHDQYVRGLSLPIWSAMSDDDVDRVIATVRQLVERGLAESA